MIQRPLKDMLTVLGKAMPRVLTYLLQVEFATTDAAPIANPYTGEIDSFITSDPDSALGVANDVAVLTTPTNNGTPRMLSTTTFGRLAGRTIVGAVRPLGADLVMAFGWTGSAGTTIATGTYFVQTGELRIRENSANINTVGTFLANFTYRLTIVMRSTGAYIFIKGGIYGDWTLLWVATAIATDMKGGWAGGSSAASGGAQFEYVRVTDLPIPFNTGDFDIATFNVTASLNSSAGSDVLTNGNFATWSGDNPTGWTITETGADPEVTERAPANGHADAVGAGGAANFFSSATDNRPIAKQANVLTSIGVWMIDGNVTKFVAGSVDMQIGANTQRSFSSAVLRRTYVGINSTTSPANDVQLFGRTGANLTFDDVSAKKLTLPTAQVMHPDSILMMSISALPASPVASQELGFCYRISAPGEELYNCFYAVIQRNAANSAWDVQLYSIVNGVRSSLTSATGVSTPDTLVIVAAGDKHYIFTGLTGTFTLRGAVATSTLFLNSTGANVVADPAATISRFASFPRRPDIGNLFQQAHKIDQPNYVAQAEFFTNQSAPLAASSNMAKGLLKKSADASGTVTLSNSKLKFSGLSVGNFVDPAYYITDLSGNGFTRTLGRVFFTQVEIKTNTARPVMFGWSKSTTAASGNTILGMYFASGSTPSAALGNATPALGATNWTIGLYTLAFVLFANGGAIYAKGGIFGTSWVLVWTEHFNSTDTPLYPMFQGVSTTDAEFEYAHIIDLPATFTGEYSLATVRDTTLASADTFTGTADGEHSFEFTLPASPAAGDEVVLQFRRQDATNYRKAYIKRNAGNTAWDFLEDRIVAGVATNEIAAVTNVGSVVELKVTAVGNLMDFYTRTGTTWTKRGAQVNNSTFAAEVGLGITAVAGTTLTAVNSIPRAVSAALIAVLDTYT